MQSSMSVTKLAVTAQTQYQLILGDILIVYVEKKVIWHIPFLPAYKYQATLTLRVTISK